MIHSFPKIFALGETYIRDIFNNEVEITEKIDGSQFCFGKIGGELYMRSKGAQLFIHSTEKMFKIAVEYVVSIIDLIPDNHVFCCEYLRTPKHNILSYERTPKNNLILFGVHNTDGFISKYAELINFSTLLNIEIVPCLFSGKVDAPIELEKYLGIDSILGGEKIEGFVVKNYYNQFLIGGQLIPLMSGKFVCDSFKEKHKTNWKGHFTGKGKWELFKESHRTEARWLKSIQHMRDDGLLDNSPRDIGKLIAEIKIDIESEEKENIKDFLYKEFGEELYRMSVAGFAEFYKKYLLTSQ